jgi:hypothetical protein
MNKERLLKVAKALRESRAPDDFTMERFGNHCGTPACAMGHYAARRDLQRTFRFGKAYLAAPRPTLLYAKTDKCAYIDHEEVLDHFGITYGQSDQLFGPHGCGNAQTANEAANYIERFVAENS